MIALYHKTATLPTLAIQRYLLTSGMFCAIIHAELANKVFSTEYIVAPAMDSHEDEEVKNPQIENDPHTPAPQFIEMIR
jgi:hypothetical protein